MARFHQTLQRECLDGKVFADLAEAQAAVDAFVIEYNYDRPHQGIKDAYPADRFRPNTSTVDISMPALKIPAVLRAAAAPPGAPAPRPPAD